MNFNIGQKTIRKSLISVSLVYMSVYQVIVVHIGMAISNQIKIPNSAAPTNGALPRDRARSSTLRFGRYSSVCVALLAVFVAVYFGIIYSNSDGGCVITASPIQLGKTVAKTPVSILLEYCQKNKLKEPEYMEVYQHKMVVDFLTWSL